MSNSIKDLLSQLFPLHHAEQERLKKRRKEKALMCFLR